MRRSCSVPSGKGTAMNLLEHQGKAILAAADLAVPRSRLCVAPTEAAAMAAEFGRVVVKAQLPVGKRGKSGGILFADGPVAAAKAAATLFGKDILGHRVTSVLVEERLEIVRELYLAVTLDAASKGPLVLVSVDGGQEVEAAFCGTGPGSRRLAVDILDGLTPDAARTLVAGLGLPDSEAVAEVMLGLYQVWRDQDAELVEVNPLAILSDGRMVAADAKIVLDDAATYRHPDRAAPPPERLTPLERRGRELGLNFIELDGEVGILANGAGLTMTTVDVVSHYGGRAANFLEIGGDAYTKAKPALELVLANPKVKSLVVNFCGAYARTDVMVDGVLDAWEALAPRIPVFFSVQGTGAREAVRVLTQRLDVEPFDRMEDAVRWAVEAAR